MTMNKEVPKPFKCLFTILLPGNTAIPFLLSSHPFCLLSLTAPVDSAKHDMDFLAILRFDIDLSHHVY